MSKLGPVRKTNMEYVSLGKSGLKVSRIILGCMSYGDPGWYDWLLPEEEGLKHIKAAYDAGIQTFDTADVYSNGLSEIILGKAIKKFDLPRDEIVVMTKFCGVVARTHGDLFRPGPNKRPPNNEGYVNQYGASRKHIFDAVKHSLERLQLDYIDVLQCHRFDPFTPIEETMQALHDVVKAGYVRYIGMSSCYAWQFHAMQNYAINNSLTPFVSMQNHYNLVYRQEEVEMMPLLKYLGVGSIPWSPLARGYTCRPIISDSKRASFDSLIQGYDNEANREISRRVEEIAKKRGLTMAQVSLIWVMNKDPVAAPIVGTTKLKNLEELIAVVHEKLTDEETKYLEEPYKPMATFGH
ncbi:Aldo keto reductase [Pyrrhoderma noxium]|uniref:Aldo keto reductase n=1 Tax=Pyrrhoderma noxium TaxID=2282107 RepID=A0A286U6P3_9AGAM|nr:Aldo keto reductase [Pyrrhoderma noxium]